MIQSSHWMKHWLAAILAALLALLSTQTPAEETITYIHWDALGSPVAATDESGNVVWRERYRPYGQRIDHEAAAGDNSRWYTGHPQDQDTGLVYAGARYYDPVVGRFLAKDPVEFQEDNLHSFNRYAYGSNNPYRYIDPDGRNAVTATGGVFVETYNWVRGKGFNGARVMGALKDGYNGKGSGLVSAAVEDTLTFGGGLLGVGAKVYQLSKAARIPTGATSRTFSKIDDITKPGSKLRNIKTDVSKSEFEKNLLENGFTKSTSRDGNVNIFIKGDKKYTTRDSSKSTEGPTAEVFKNNQPVSKIRLGSE